MSCDGTCCAIITAAVHPGVLVMTDPEQRHGENAAENLTLLGMLEPLTLDEAQERVDRFAARPQRLAPAERFRCRHWDEETRLCTNYENRPRVCRSYPEWPDRPVCHDGCTCWGELVEPGRPRPLARESFIPFGIIEL